MNSENSISSSWKQNISKKKNRSEANIRDKAHNLLPLLEKWENAFITDLTQKANLFQENILEIKKQLNQKISLLDKASLENLETIESALLKINHKVVKIIDSIADNKADELNNSELIKKIIKKLK